jgi:glutathione S-transferase
MESGLLAQAVMMVPFARPSVYMSVNLNRMKLYHTEWCPECEAVREKLAELGFSYEDEIVPDVRPFRKKLYEVSGQYYVPVLVHGETVLTETSDILAYLDNYEDHGHPSGADRQEVSKPPSSSLDERNH